MENGVVMDAKEGSPQGGNLLTLLANVYLNEFNQEFQKRGVPFVRYADDIILLAKSERAAKRLLETSTNISLHVNFHAYHKLTCNAATTSP